MRLCRRNVLACLMAVLGTALLTGCAREKVDLQQEYQAVRTVWNRLLTAIERRDAEAFAAHWADRSDILALIEGIPMWLEGWEGIKFNCEQLMSSVRELDVSEVLHEFRVSENGRSAWIVSDLRFDVTTERGRYRFNRWNTVLLTKQNGIWQVVYVQSSQPE